MNWFTAKHSPAPETPAPPPHNRLGEAFHALQTHVSSFLQKPQNLFFNLPPIDPTRFWAKIVPYNVFNNTCTSFNSELGNNLAISDDEIEARLCMVPLYRINIGHGTVSLMVSPLDQRNSIDSFFLNEADADALAEYAKSTFPYREFEVVRESFDHVLNSIDAPVRLIPDALQVKIALEVKKKAGVPDESFRGVPVFQSRNLCLTSKYNLHLTNEGCLNESRPVFFRKEDLEKYLAKARAASQRQGSNLSDVKTDIEVAVLEDIIQGMRDNSSSEWNNVVFAHRGADIPIGPSAPTTNKERRVHNNDL